MGRVGRFLLLSVATLLVVGIGAVVWLRHTGTEFVRPLVIRSLEQVTGREVTIAGTFDLQLSMTPTLVAEDIRIGNAPWGTRESMIEVERAEFRVALWPLIRHRELRVERMRLIEPTILLETDGDRANWRFHERDPQTPDRPAGRFLLEHGEIVDGRLVWSDLATGSAKTALLTHATWDTQDITDRLSLAATGEIDGLPVELRGTVGSIANLVQKGDPYPIDLTAHVAELTVTAQGRLVPQSDKPELHVVVAGENLATIGRIAGATMPAMPKIGPFRVEADLRASQTAGIEVQGLRARAGAEDGLLLEAQGSIADAASAAGIDVKVSATGPDLAEAVAPWAPDLSFSGPFEAAARLTGDLTTLSLRDIEAAARLNGTRLRVAGEVDRLQPLAGLDLGVSARGADLRRLLDDVAPGEGSGPALPFSARTRITGGELRYDLNGLQIELAGSDLQGNLSVVPAEDLRLSGTLRSQTLDPEQLLALGGQSSDGGPQGGERPTEQDAAPAAANKRLFGDEPLPFGLLQEGEGKLAYEAARIEFDGADARKLDLTASLTDGRLLVDPLSLMIAGGEIRGDLIIDSRPSPPTVTLSLTARGLRLAEVFDRWPLGEKLEGRMGLRLDVKMAGQSVRDLMASMDGSGAVVVDGGRLRDTHLNLLVADLDLLNLLPFIRRDKGYVDVNCFVGQFKVTNGTVDSDLLLDTDRMTLMGEGTVLLDEETVDLQLVPEAKGGKVSTIAVPVDIRGSLARPVVKPRTGVAAGQAAIGVLGGLLVPLNLFAGILGGSEQSQCESAIRGASGAQQPASGAAPR